MTQTRTYLHALNIGVVDRDKTHRVDIERMRLAAEIQENLMADAVGKGFFRPGFGYKGTTKSNNAAKPIPFIAGVNDSFGLEFTDSVLRVLDTDTDTFVTHRNNATTPGAFTGWTMASTAGQTSAAVSGKLELSARARGGLALSKKQVTLVDGNETAVKIVVERGPVQLRIGSADGLADYLPDDQETTLRTGTHIIAFTPNAFPGSYWIQFSSTRSPKVIVSSVVGTGDGTTPMELPTPYTSAMLKYLRPTQSADVMFMFCAGVRPLRIERRGDKSWSICDYQISDGPFLVAPTADLELTPSVTEGNGTLTASRAFFNANHVGALFRIFHDGQRVETYLAGANEFGPAIEVSGITESNFEERKFTTTIAGTWSGTLRHQRSFNDADAGYNSMRREQASATIDITANATFTNDDNEDNVVEWVRVGFPPGLYTSGEAQLTMVYPGGSGVGICRVVGYTSPTVVDIEVLVPFKGKTATKDWLEGAWSAQQGYPVAGSLNDGRLFFLGNDKWWASVSDAFESIDPDFEGDAGAIDRAIALGGRNNGVWFMALSSLMVGLDGRIANIRASSLDEVVTGDNAGVKSAGKVGAAPISPVELADDRGVFVERGGNRLYEVTWSSEKVRYVVNPFSKLTTRPFKPGIRGLDVQTLPDQRIWATINDSPAVCTVIEPTQNVIGFVTIATRPGDVIEEVCIIPGEGQDRTYLIVKRTINGNTVRYWERMAADTDMEFDLENEPIVPCVDSYLEFGAGQTPSLPHLVGATVYGWSDGGPVLDETVTDPAEDNAQAFVVQPDGSLLPAPPAIAAGAVYGLRYTARYKSARLAYGAPGATPMQQRQHLDSVGLLLSDYVRSGVKFGTEFDNENQPLTSLPQMSEATGDPAEEIVEGPGLDEGLVMAGSEWNFNRRLCIEIKSPKPAALLAVVMAITS